MRSLAASCGLAGVALFLAAFVIFSALDTEFQLFDDYVSELGATGKTYGLWFNLIGFVGVGLLLALFGIAYGHVLGDRLVGGLLTAFGLGFAFTAVPIEDTVTVSTLSKVHIVAICLGLGAWMLALARLAHLRRLGSDVRLAANTAAGLFLIPVAGHLLQFWTMPVTHRLVFTVVFGWFVWTASRLLVSDRQA